MHGDSMTGLWLWVLVGCTDDATPKADAPSAPTTDTAPQEATTDTAPEELPSGSLEPAGNALFGNHLPIEVAVDIDEADIDALRLAPREWVPATVSIEGFPAEPGAVRLKGNGSFQPIDDKPSLKIDLARLGHDGAIDGLDDLVLNNMSSDPTMMRETSAYAMYRQAGVPAPRTRHAIVTLNGEPRGIYLLLEDVDGRFLDRWFDDGDGPLYEMFDVELTPEGVDQLDHDGGPDDRSTLHALADVLADPESRVSVEAAELIDLDAFVNYFAVSGVIGQFDAYPYSFPGDDLYLYVDPTSERVHFLPHGTDETFQERDRPIDYVFGLLAVRCLEDPVCEARFDAAVWSTLELQDREEFLLSMEIWSFDVDAFLVDEALRADWNEGRRDRISLFDYVRTRREMIVAMPGIE